ncbi:MAG: tetratricopeptide repeat protein [Anaerolineae bacterium]|nr:tetratricopeptide repeat protein [Anaerolineae bacterium]
MTRLELSVLGSFKLTIDALPVEQLGSDVALAALAYLAVDPARSYSREVLSKLFWPERSISEGLQHLRKTLQRLRDVIADREAKPPFLHVTRSTIHFNAASDYWLDVSEFTRAVDASKRHVQHTDASRTHIHHLKQAVALYRGDFLEGIFVSSEPFEAWVRQNREYYHRQVIEALFWLADYHRSLGEYSEAYHYARRQVELEPWREEAHQQAMELLALDEQRSAALAYYETYRRILAENLGVEPAVETTALYRRIRAGEMGGDAALTSFPTQRRQERARATHHLPAQGTPFTGREKELSEVVRRLRDPARRLVALVGAGGVGKTRLSLAAAEQVLEDFPDGAWFVGLTDRERGGDGVSNANHALILAVAEVMGIELSGRRAPYRELLGVLQDKELLVVLDNLELMAEEETQLLAALDEMPGVKVLITSRGRMGLSGEDVVPIEGLPVPASELEPGAAEYSSVQLFAERAGRAAGGFDLNAETLPGVIRICRAVSGYPLGIELAAAWVGKIRVDEIARLVEADLNQLETTMRDVPARHRSMRAVFDGSWELLGEGERAALAGVSVFAGRFDEVAARAVVDVERAVLRSLVDKSLLRESEQGRYELHGLVRQFAREKLAERGEEARACERHGVYYLELMGTLADALVRQGADALMEQIGGLLEDVRRAWMWAVTDRQYAALDRGMGGLARLYLMMGLFREGEAAFGASVSRLQTEGAGEKANEQRVARLQVELARFLNAQAKHEQASMVLAAAERAAVGDEALTAMIQLEWGRALWPRGAHAEARRRIEDALALAHVKKMRALEADGLFELGSVCFQAACLEEGQAYVEHALALYSELGDRRGEGLALNRLGVGAMRWGRYAEAQAYYEESARACREAGDVINQRVALLNLGRVLAAQGKYDVARTHYEGALRSFRESQQRFGECLALRNIGEVYLRLGDWTAAQNCLDPALKISREIRYREVESEVLMRLAWLASLQQQHQTAEAYAGRALRICQDIEHEGCERDALFFLGNVLVGLKRMQEAEAAYRKAIALWQRGNPDLKPVEPLSGLIRVALAEGRIAEALVIADEVLIELASRPGLEGTYQPLDVYLAVYDALRESRDRRAEGLLGRAYALLKERSTWIADERLHRLFLEQVPVHQIVVQAWRARQT